MSEATAPNPLPCGCRITTGYEPFPSCPSGGSGQRIIYCPLHAAAGQLLVALKGLEYPDEPGRFCDHPESDIPCERCQVAAAAIAAAEGKA